VIIQIRMSVADLGRARFAYSPLAEVTESLYLLASGRLPALHQDWFATVRGRLSKVDLALLSAVVPARRVIADCLFAGAVDRTTTIEQQLRTLADTPADRLSKELSEVWHGERMPDRARELLADGPAGPRRLADVLWDYWSVALEPHWPAMRAVLDDDVAYRATELTKGGVATMLTGLHQDISVHDELLRIRKKRFDDFLEERDLAGVGLMLVPSVFVWPSVVFAVSAFGPPSLTYAARGVGNLAGDGDLTTDEDALGALLGRSRAAILVTLALPHSTTELSLKLGQSPSSVSQHLSVLRRSGLVTSWRSGRRVLYRRTDLATSIVEANSVAPAAGWHTPA
jgi:DNA-binding transcriptional ArsR family regulator